MVFRSPFLFETKRTLLSVNENTSVCLHTEVKQHESQISVSGGNIGGFGDTRSPGPVVSPGNYGGDSRNQGPVLGNQDPASANNQQGPMSGHQGNFRDARAPGAMMQQRPGFIDGRNNYGGPVLQVSVLHLAVKSLPPVPPCVPSQPRCPILHHMMW